MFNNNPTFLEMTQTNHIPYNAAAIESALRRSNLSSYMPLSPDVTPREFSLEGAKKYKFRSIATPSLGVYLKTFCRLANKNITVSLVTDMITIALDTKMNNSLIIPKIVDEASNKVLECSNPEKYYDITWGMIRVFTDLETLPTSAKRLQKITEVEFRTWMNCFCMIWLSAIFKDVTLIKDKLNNLSRGFDLLSFNYTGPKQFWPLDETTLNKLKVHFKNHIYRAELAVLLINAYYTSKRAKEDMKRSFLSWTVMTSTYLMGYGVVKHLLLTMDILNITFMMILDLILDKNTLTEAQEYVKVADNILLPPTSNKMEEMIYYKWCGMIYDHYHVKLRLKQNPYTSSLLIGVLDGSRQLNNELPVEIVSFKPSAYKKLYYDYGVLIATEGVKDVSAEEN